MDTSQYAELFLTESRENITSINHSLLDLERVASDGPSPEATASVNTIFRAVHTIKGMSAMMGYETVAELSHELETVLDRVRQGDLPVDDSVLDLFFRSADTLEQSIESAVAGRDGEISTTALLIELKELGISAAPPIANSTTWTVAAPTGAGVLVRVRLNPDTPLKGVRAFIVVQTAGRLGVVTAVEPPVEQLQADGFESDFALRLETETPNYEIKAALQNAGDVAAVSVGEETAGVGRRASGVHRLTPAMTAAVPAHSETPTPDARRPTPDAPRPTTETRHIRIDLRRLDNLMNLIGELVIARGRLTQIASTLADSSLDDTVAEASRLITELRDEITASRMVPAWQVFDRFPRVVRDASRAVGKQVELTIEGKDIELDRSMLDEIGDSIVHLLRNAIDHGIEPPEWRLAAGKPVSGHLRLSAERDRSAVVIKVSDDGKGIARQRVLAKAKAEGMFDASKTELTEDELLRVLARPGFSTAEKVTSLSGRGVGIDAVYTRVRALGGAMDIRSVQGQGTTMILRLPLTLAIVRALLARVADETYAIPLAHVSETVELVPEIVRTVQGKEVLLRQDEVLPLMRLRELVGLPAYEAPNAIDLEQVIVIDVGDRRAALVIDELTGQEEIVVKQYDAVRDGLRFFGGATLLSDGSPSLIVDVSSLL